MVDLGGQVSVSGPRRDGSPWLVAIAHPGDRNRPSIHVALRQGSLSTSGGSERDLQVDGTRIGHILDPRTGRPAPFVGAVTVWHERGLVADILSTALYVMGRDVGLAWAEQAGVAAAYLTLDDDSGLRIATTPAFDRLIERE